MLHGKDQTTFDASQILWLKCTSKNTSVFAEAKRFIPANDLLGKNESEIQLFLLIPQELQRAKVHGHRSTCTDFGYGVNRYTHFCSG